MLFKKLLKVLIKDSIGDLFKYNSFLVLICFLILLDKGVEIVMPENRNIFSFTDLLGSVDEAADFIFIQAPEKVYSLIHDYRFFLVLFLLFLFKQLTSLWPSSDMRLMHRQERGVFGIFISLISLKLGKIVWDTFAVFSIAGSALLWLGISFISAKIILIATGPYISLTLLGILILPVIPLSMAGLSYSSKIAVIDQGGFKEKFLLFSKLLTDFKIFWQSLVFYLTRSVIEIAFVAIIPIIILAAMDIKWLRIILALMVATPVYSFLKMASFKFFLFVYRDHDLIKKEYKEYYLKTGF